MPDYKPLADQLRDAIEGSHLPILAIAKETGIPQPVLHRFYVGDRDNLTLTTADKLEELVDKAIDLHGGVTELAEAIVGDAHAYIEQHPGSLRSVQHVERLMWLVGRCLRKGPTSEETLATLSDEGLDEVIRVLSREVLDEVLAEFA